MVGVSVTHSHLTGASLLEFGSSCQGVKTERRNQPRVLVFTCSAPLFIEQTAQSKCECGPPQDVHL